MAMTLLSRINISCAYKYKNQMNTYYTEYEDETRLLTIMSIQTALCTLYR